MRLFRLLKFNASLNNIFTILHINKGVGKLITVMVSVMFVVHMVACAWYWICDYNGFEPDCWVVRQNLTDASIEFKYISAAYWAFQTLCTVGYGDIPAVTSYEKGFAILWMIGGFGFYSYTIGNVQVILNEIDVRTYHLQLKLDTILDFSKRTGLPPQLQHSITRYIHSNAFNDDIMEPKLIQLLDELPLSLKGKLTREAFAEIIPKIKFFQDKPDHFLWQFIPKMKQMHFFAGEYLFKQREHADEVYFILKGKVKLVYDLTEGEID